MDCFNKIVEVIQHTFVCLKRNEMDFKGQKLAFLIKNIILSISTVIAIIYGYYFESLASSCYIILIGAAITSLLVIPTWPIYNRHQIEWGYPDDGEKELKKIR